MASYSTGARQILDLLHDRVVAYHPALAPILGGPDEALFVSQLLYWETQSPIATDPERPPCRGAWTLWRAATVPSRSSARRSVSRRT